MSAENIRTEKMRTEETHVEKVAAAGSATGAVEQADAFTEKYRYQVYFDLIEPSGLDELLDDIRTTYHPDIFVPGCGFRLL